MTPVSRERYNELKRAGWRETFPFVPAKDAGVPIVFATGETSLSPGWALDLLEAWPYHGARIAQASTFRNVIAFVHLLPLDEAREIGANAEGYLRLGGVRPLLDYLKSVALEKEHELVTYDSE